MNDEAPASSQGGLLPGPYSATVGVQTASWPRNFLEGLAPLRCYRRNGHADAMMINQGSYRLTEDPETAHSNSSPAKPAVFHPPVDSPSADVQNPSCFINTEKPFLLQYENRVHDSSPPHSPLSAS